MSRRKQKVLLDSLELEGGDFVLKPGKSVMLRPEQKGAASYIARIEQIEQQQPGAAGQVWLVCRWYYRPEESIGGRRHFHGMKEVFLSDHMDRCFPEAVQGECRVHTLRAYTALQHIEEEDFFCRFQYNATTGLLSPDKVAVYCTCEMPFNPDKNMLYCTQCKDLFHPECVGQPKKGSASSGASGGGSSKAQSVCKVERFICPSCDKERPSSRPTKIVKTDKTARDSDVAAA